ncbi:MAG: D-alanyl-D-alanine carboxypeptidase/D-alanyl-D-alanine endopeptidase [Acidobacteriaceae bacterium]
MCHVLLLALLLSLVLPAFAQRRHSHPVRRSYRRALPLRTLIAQTLADPRVSAAHWGISVTTQDGRPIYSLNDAQFFQPASNTKLFTTAAALALLGPEYTAKTYLLESGTVTQDGRLQGELRILGAGDPSLSSRVYPYNPQDDDQRLDSMPAVFNDFAGVVARSGIVAIDGTLVADDTFFPYERYGAGWSWDDLQWDYGAPVSALTVNDNTMYLTVQVGAQFGAPVHVDWSIPNNDFTLDTTGLMTGPVGSKRQLGVERQPGTTRIRLYGQVPAGSNPIHLALATEYPAAYAADLFRQELFVHGITLQGGLRTSHRDDFNPQPFREEAREPLVFKSQAAALAALQPSIPSGDRLLATHTAPPLIEDITVTNKLSLNLHAELLLHLLGRAYGRDGSAAEGARVVRQFLENAGVQPDDFIFYDGSGLSNNDMVTPRAITTLLRYAARQPWGMAYRRSLPIGGVDGTLQHRFENTPLKGRVFAKTGTLSEASALSGYMIAASGRTLVFSMMVDNHVPGTHDDRIAMDRILNMIAAAN